MIEPMSIADLISKSKINFKNYDDDKMIVSNKSVVQNLIHSSFNSIMNDNFCGSKLGDSMIKSVNDINLSMRKSGRSNKGNLLSKRSLVFVSAKDDKLNDSLIDIIPSMGFTGGSIDKDTISNTLNTCNTLNTNPNEKKNKLRNSLNNLIFRNSFTNNQSGVIGYTPKVTEARKSSTNNNNNNNNMNDLSISLIQGSNNPSTNDLFSNPEKLLKTSTKNPSFSQSNVASTNKYNTFLSGFKRFTFKGQGKDENGNEIINLDKQDEILSHGLDQSSVLSNSDEKLLDEIKFEDSLGSIDLDENIGDRNNVFNYRLESKAALLLKDNKINIRYLLQNYYENLDDINEDKIKAYESELRKMRDKKEKVLMEKNKINALKISIIQEKANLVSSIKNEHIRIERIGSLDISKIDQYDKLRFHEMSLKNEQSNFNIDIEKYVDINVNKEDENEINEEKLIQEMKMLKLQYDEKSKKYKEIIRKLKEMISKKTIELTNANFKTEITV